jgi:hypothetical protein
MAATHLKNSSLKPTKRDKKAALLTDKGCADKWMPVAMKKKPFEKTAKTVLMRPPPNPTRIKVRMGSLSILSFFRMK